MGPFRDAGRDPAWQERQVDDFLTRLDTAVGGRPTGYSHPISDYVTSERGVALVLDQSVNRPGHVNGDVGRALNDFSADHPEAPRDPTRWTATQRAQYEPEILQRYVPYRADHGLPMTNNDQRAQAINGNSNVSAQPGSFERPGRPSIVHPDVRWRSGARAPVDADDTVLVHGEELGRVTGGLRALDGG